MFYKKEITKLIYLQKQMDKDLEEMQEDITSLGILLNKINDKLEKALLSQNQKSESKGIFGLNKRK
tara:strand:- start:6665 stop:6862 length:198 start_codon:yes stop_codon:yes gene_type:complete